MKQTPKEDYLDRFAEVVKGLKSEAEMIELLPKAEMIELLPKAEMIELLPKAEMIELLPKAEMIELLPKAEMIELLPKAEMIELLPKAEMIELLPKKKVANHIKDNYYCLIVDGDTPLCELEAKMFNEAIDLCLKALRGKVKRGLSVEEIQDILKPLLAKHHVTREHKIEHHFALSCYLAQAIYKAQGQENKVNQGLLEACKRALAYCWKSTNDNPEKFIEQAIKSAEEGKNNGK